MKKGFLGVVEPGSDINKVSEESGCVYGQIWNITRAKLFVTQGMPMDDTDQR